MHTAHAMHIKSASMNDPQNSGKQLCLHQ